MKFIANILTDKTFDNVNLYNIVSDKAQLIEDIPTLVIGWEYTKKMFPNANILEWEIEENVYWTYGKREKRNRYEENLEKFKELSIRRFVKSVKYNFYNIMTISNEEKLYILNLIDVIGSYIYVGNDMLYIVDGIKNEVVGISIRDIEYNGGDKKKIFSKIYKNPNNNVVTLNEETLPWEFRRVLSNYSYVIPYLFR